MSKYDSEKYGFNVVANGRNFNAIRLLTGGDDGRLGHRLLQLNFHFKGKTVLVILKKESPMGPQVAFMEAASLDAALWVVAMAIKSKSVPWKADKWGTIRNDKGGDIG